MGQVDTILNLRNRTQHEHPHAQPDLGRLSSPVLGELVDLGAAKSSDPLVSGPAKTNLMNAIANRISYYVGDGDADTADGDRSQGNTFKSSTC